MRRSSVRIGLIVGVAAGLAALAGLAQEAAKQERPLRHDAAAVIKLVPVRVLGPDGRPLQGLRKEDFSLFEDGERRVITEFEVHALPEAASDGTPAPAPAAPPAARSDTAVRKIFLFLDQQASDEAGKAKAKTAALRFLDTEVRAGDEVAVIGFYAMSGFYIRQYLTSDLSRVRRAISKPGEAPPRAGDMVLVADDTVDAGAMTEGINVWVAGGDNSGRAAGAGQVSDATPGTGGGVIATPGTASFQRTDFVPRLEDLIEVLKTVPGNKSLVLFTSRDLGHEAERLGKLFGAAGTTVFAVNTQDWKMSPMGGAKVHFIWEEHSLKDLAAASGGKYFADINAAETIARDLQSLTGNYYVLGYYVQEGWEGRFHKIRVEVARPEARILVQDGYADPKPYGQMSEFEKGVQLIDLAWADRPVTAFLPLEVDPLLFFDAGSVNACLVVRLDVNARTGLPPGRNEIFIFVRGEAGAASLSRRWEVDLSRYDGKRLFAHAIVPVPSGSQELRVVVRDLVNGAACVGRAVFEVPDSEAGGLRISSPLLFEPGGGTVYLKLPGPASGGKKAGTATEPTLLDLYRLIPKDARLVVGEISAGVRKITAVVPVEYPPGPGDEPPILALEAWLTTGKDGGEIPVDVKILGQNRVKGKPDIIVADIFFPDLAPGFYDLEITVEEIGWERRATFRKSVLVR
jgi:VWFA-related protein